MKRVLGIWSVSAVTILSLLVLLPTQALAGKHGQRRCSKATERVMPSAERRRPCRKAPIKLPSVPGGDDVAQAPSIPAGGQVAGGTAATGPSTTAEEQPPAPTKVYIVSPVGNDAWPGTDALPLKTIGRALELSTGGELILVTPGEYPGFQDTRQRSVDVTVRGIEAPTVAGASLAGNSHVVIEGLKFTAGIAIRRHPTFATRVAEQITIRDSELTNANPLSARCMTIRDGARQILVEGNDIHDCKSGIDGPGYGFSDPSLIPYSNHIAIRDNRFDRFRADAIQFAYWRDVEITDNRITNMYDPNHVEHNDGIQIMGGSARVAITRNVIAHSGGQLILVQGAVGGMNDDVAIRDNLSYDSVTYAWQLGDVTNLKVWGNTVWKSKYGGILLRPRAYASVANNVSDFIGSSFGNAGGAYTYFDYNLIGRTYNTAGPHSLVGVDPKFVDLANDDYRLQPASRAIGAGNPSFAGAADLMGNPRPNPPSMGALEPGSAPVSG